MNKLALLSCLLLAGAFGCGGGDDSALRGEKEKLEANIRVLEQEKIQKQEENDRLQNEREALRAESARLQDESNGKSTEFDEEKKSWADARQSLIDQNEELQQKLQERNDLLDEQKKWTAANQALHEEIDRLKVVLAEETGKFEQQTTESSRIRETLNNDLKRLEQELAQLDESNRKLEEEVSQLRNDLLFAQNGSTDADRLSKEITGLREANKEVKERNAQLRASISDLNNRLADLQSSSEQQKQKLADKTARIDQLDSDKQSLETENAELHKQLDAEKAKLQSSVNGLLASNLELSNKVREIQTALDAEAQKNSKASQLIVDLREQLQNVENLRVTDQRNHQSVVAEKSSTIVDLTKTIETLKTDCEDLLNEKVWLEGVLEKSDTLVDSLKAEKKKLETEIADVTQTNNKLREEVLGLQSLLASGEADYKKIKELNEVSEKQLEALRQQRETDLNQYKSLETTTSAQIDSLSASINKLEAEKQRLIDEKIALESSVDGLNAEVRRREIEKKKQIADYEKLTIAMQSLDVDYESLEKQLDAERTALKNKGGELISAKKELNKRISELEALLENEKVKVSQKDESLIEIENKLAEEKRKGQEAIKAAEENERLRVRSEGSADSLVDLHKEIQELKSINHGLKADNEKVKSTVEKLASDLLSRDDPHEIFKRASQEFLAQLGTERFSNEYSKNQIATFKEDIRYLAGIERLLDDPEQDPKRFGVPLALIFDQAPKQAKEFTVYIASASDNWDDLEKTAQFILATDDQKMLEELLVQKGKGELDYHEFKVQVDFPILCLGPKVFMLPKTLLNPQFEHEMSKVIELNYGFDEGLTEPLEYQTYLEKKKIRDDRVAKSKNQAAKPEHS